MKLPVEVSSTGSFVVSGALRPSGRHPGVQTLGVAADVE